MIYVYILDINPLSNMICKYFSHSAGCLFTWIFNLMSVNFFVFCFIACALKNHIKKIITKTHVMEFYSYIFF